MRKAENFFLIKYNCTKIVNFEAVIEDKNIIYLQLSFYTRRYTNKKNYVFVILWKIVVSFMLLSPDLIYTKIEISLNSYEQIVSLCSML